MIDLKNLSLKYFLSLENRARFKLIKRYNKPVSYHNVKIINDILYNEKTHYVEQFKEYLIYEDYNEFLKRFYRSYEINLKLKKILVFYEKYSKIYANYTVIPESRYMYKNIKRKQKMIDQMQNNGNNNSEYEEEEESNDEKSNTIFSSRVINSIYGKTITSLNKSETDGYTEQSINDFLGKINFIENKINNFMKNLNNNKDNQILKEDIFHNKKSKKDYFFNKTKTTKKMKKINDGKNNKLKSKIIDIQFTQSKKVLPNQNEGKKNTQNISNNKINVNNNSNKNNHSNLIFINSYASKNKNIGNIYSNNNSIGNNSNYTYNNNNTFNGNKNLVKPNTIFPEQKIPSTLLKQNIINISNNLNNYKENMNLTSINNYLTNINNNIKNDQKYKLNLGENILKLDKVVLSTNISSSPKIMNEKIFSLPKNKINILENKNQQIIKEKENNEKQIQKKNNKNKSTQTLSSNKIINSKKIKSHLLGTHNYNSLGNNLTFLSNKFLENHKLKNMSNKPNKKKSNKKLNAKKNEKKINKDNNNEFSANPLNKIYKKPESHRNYCHSKMFSGNHSNTKNKISNNSGNFNKNYQNTVGLKHDTKHNSKKIISTPCSPSSSLTNFYFQSHVNSRKNSINNLDKNIKKTLNENKNKKVVNNFNLVNNIHDNSTQINIYTGNNLYKSLHFINNNSVFNNSNITPANTNSKSPIVQCEGNIKNEKNKEQVNLKNNNTSYFNSNIKGKEKIEYNLDLKRIINKKNIESEKAIISARQITNRKLFEKLGKYFFKNKIEKNNINNINYNSNKNINIKHNRKNNNIKNKNNYNEYNLLINKIINKNCNSSKTLKNKTNNNTPIKNKYVPYIVKNNRKVSNCLSPQDYDQIEQMNKRTSRQNINYNSNIISNLNDWKNIGIDEGTKLLIHSERNKICKIIFK